MQVGIVDYLLRVKEEAGFFLAQELRFDCLELSIDQTAESARLLADPLKVEQFDELRAETGVQTHSVYATLAIRLPLLGADAKAREAAQENLRHVSELAAKRGVRTIVVPLVGASEIQEESAKPHIEPFLERLTQWAQSFGVRFALESAITAHEWNKLLERFPAKEIGVCFQPGNCRMLGRDPEQEARLLGHRILHVHLKDRTDTGEGIGLQEDDVRLPRIFAAIAATGYTGPIVLETPAGRSAIESAKKNLRICRDWLTAA